MPAIPRDCPCHSKRRYKACCGPFHDGEAPATATELMRSRYSAFALNRGAYLLETLAASHPDRKEHDARSMTSSRQQQRFLDLKILHEAEHGERAEVLFYARLFERGHDQSLLELSSFVREDGRWRYAEGVLMPASALEGPVEALDREGFLAQANAWLAEFERDEVASAP